MKKILVSGIMALAIGAMALPASASTQTIDATLGSTLSMTATPSSTVSWSLASSGSNTTSGGTLTANSNQPYIAAVTADKTKMTEWVSGAYVSSSPKTLATALSILSSRSSGTAAVPGVGATAVVGTSTTLATGTGLGTDSYDITLSQPTLITDSALSTGTYHIVLTYTLSSTL
jgi:hypothetical protein